VLLAINFARERAGGTLYGGLRFRWPIERQFAAALGIMSIPLLAHALFLQPVAFAITGVPRGSAHAPSIAAQNVLVSRLAPPQYATEAFTWSSCFILLGLGAGMALGGVLVEYVGVRANFAAGARIVACMALLTSSRSPHLLLERLQHPAQRLDLGALEARAPEEPAQPLHQASRALRVEVAARDHGRLEVREQGSTSSPVAGRCARVAGGGCASRASATS
jgi:hypothetical protein